MLAAEILGDTLGVPLPEYREARLRSENVTDDRLAELRADAVIEYWEKTRRFAVIVEVQLDHDRGKHFSWPAYMMGLRARLRCPVILLVLSPDQTAAKWCARTIDLGHPGMTLTPIVLGPREIPYVTDPEHAARVPELAVLSALAHGAAPGGAEVLSALPDAYAALDGDHRALYHDIVVAVLPETMRRHLEARLKLKNYEFQSDFARRYFGLGKAQGKDEGKTEGTVEMILVILAARGIEVPEDVRARITGCEDPELLKEWGRRAATADSIDDVLID
ncbi:hypothetical protein [Actinomadura sp. NBRC 104425]|uniref:hypothetical protein n=1 Tax=Actinomadura sp. NBRC 104425 TaxID=3032204 RepID=UPI002555C71B|nr:hypothetical protein [Actinomadura sp. NBRC 104425]